jgi:hypothetical protein
MGQPSRGSQVEKENCPVLKEAPDHHDADLVLKLYELRQDEGMRESRNAINTKFWPRTAEEAIAITSHEHPLNLAYRQAAGYWEMVYGLARHGIVPADFLVEYNGEGLLLFARVEPYLSAFREATSPRAFRNAEWVAKNCDMGRTLMDDYRAQTRRVLQAAR